MDKLEKLMFELGIYQCQEGYDCILAAMELVVEDPKRLKRLTKVLYPLTAARCDCGRPSVERNIRSSIAKGWEANPEGFSKIARRKLTQAPTTWDFLCMLYEYLKQIRNG